MLPKYETILISLVLIITISGCVEIKINLPNGDQNKIEQTPSEKSTSNISNTDIVVPNPSASNVQMVTPIPNIQTVITTPAQTAFPVVTSGTISATVTPDVVTSAMKSPIHIYHIGPESIKLDCDNCHGFPPNVMIQGDIRPEGRIESYGVCGNCHKSIRDSTCGAGTSTISTDEPASGASKDLSKVLVQPPHIYHVGPESAKLTCDTCHGFPPNTNRLSGKIDSYGVCGNCHKQIRDSTCGTGTPN